MKKKLLVMFCLGIFLLAMLIEIFPMQTHENNAKIAYASIEGQYYDEDSIDILSINPGTISNAAVETNCAPFDDELKQRMPGSLVTPNSDKYGQVRNKTFAINSFTPSADQSIFMWVYLISQITFKLKISFYDGSSNTISWEFDSQQVYNMSVGWKLLELKLSDLDTEDYMNNNYNFITINYYSEAEDHIGEEGYESYDIETNERFSIYHIFLSKSANIISNSGIIYSLDKVFYEFNEDFMSKGSVFIGDKIEIKSPSKIFSYLVIGKYDMANYAAVEKFVWSISVTDPDSVKTELDFGDTINFYNQGFYRITFQIFEKNPIVNILLQNIDLNIFCEEFCIGKFVMGNTFSVIKNEKILLTYKLADGIIVNGDFDVSASNNNIEIDSYYEEDGVVYVWVSAINKGSSSVMISAKAQSKFNSKVTDYSSVANIKIKNTNSIDKTFLIILWIVFSSFVATFVIYIVISVVKSRKNDVK